MSIEDSPPLEEARESERVFEQIVDVPMPQILKERIVEHSHYVPVPPILKEIVEVVLPRAHLAADRAAYRRRCALCRRFCHRRVQQHTVERMVGVPMLEVVADIVERVQPRTME